MAFSFQVCQFVPIVDTSDSTLLSPDIDKREMCVDLASVSKSPTRNCANGETPPLKTQVEGAIEEWQYEDPLATDRSNAQLGINLSIWMGIEERAGEPCLWMGQEEAGVCVSECEVNADGQPVLADMRALADVFVEELQENTDFITDSVATVLVAILVAALVAYATSSAFARAVAGAAA